MKLRISKRRLINVLLASLPLLNCYSFSFSQGFSFAMMGTALIAIIAILDYMKGGRLIRFTQPVCFFFMGLVLTLISVSNNRNIDIGSMVFTIAKVFIWAVVLTLGGSIYFSKNLFLIYSKKIILITFIYLLGQYFAHYVLHINVPNAINLGIIVPNYDSADWVMTGAGDYFRPGSLWTEPSFLGYYYNYFLCMCLFDNDTSGYLVRNEKRILTRICIIGSILSLSSSAIGVTLILIAFKVFLSDSKKAKKIIITIIILGLFGYAAIHFKWIEVLYGIDYNLDLTIYKLTNLSANGRTGQSFAIINDLSLFQKIFGIGYGNEHLYDKGRYLNGVVTIILWTGYIGLVAWIHMFISLARKMSVSIAQKLELIVFLSVGLFAGFYFGPMSFCYLLLGVFQSPEDFIIEYSNL